MKTVLRCMDAICIRCPLDDIGRIYARMHATAAPRGGVPVQPGTVQGAPAPQAPTGELSPI
jgi:hypothetical protein